MRMPALIFLTSFQLLSAALFSQTAVPAAEWYSLEQAIHKKEALDATRHRLESIKEQAIKRNDDIDLARACCYLMLVNDIKTEDTLYFQNSCFIDSILTANGTLMLKGLMHYLQAQRLWTFRTKSLKFNRARYEMKTLPYNYAAFDDKTIDSLVEYHFEQAHQMLAADTLPLEKIIWLSSSPAGFLFKPAMADIIYQEEITCLRSLNRFSAGYRRSYAWFSLSQDAFVDTLKSLPAEELAENKIIKKYIQWLDYCGNNKDRFYFIETLAHQYVFDDSYYYDSPDMQKEYEKYLKTLQSSPYNMVKATGIARLCILWQSWSRRYAVRSYYRYDMGSQFDTSYQSYAAKALQLFEQNKSLFEPFGVLKNELQVLQDVMNQELALRIAEASEPGKPILATLEYKNVSTLFYRIIPVGVREGRLAEEGKAAALKEMTPIRVETLPLPGYEDHNLHRSVFKIDSLPIGNYCILFSADSGFKEHATSCKAFTVTALSLVYADDKVYVLDRTTGMPVAGARVEGRCIDRRGYNKEPDTTYRHFVSSKNGSFSLSSGKTYELTVSYKGDTLTDAINTEKNNRSDDAYNKKEDDGLVDYYNEHTRVAIFTDRAIYRPGQKVYFKTLFITHDPATGSAVVMNTANLRKGFRNYLKKWKEEEDPMLFLKDAFGKTRDSVKIEPDEYGAVSGTFTIPKNGVTGTWRIDPDYLDTYYNDGSIEVEEYKRPGFELRISPPEKTYRYDDTLVFKMHVKSFAGANLSNVTVKYTIKREQHFFKEDENGNYYKTTTLFDTIGHTDANGALVITITDTAWQRAGNAEKADFTYDLDAAATDATGETHSERSSLRVSSEPVLIQIPIDKETSVDELRPLLLTTKDINGLATTAQLKVRLYRLPPKQQFDDSVYQSTDRWIQSAGDLQAWFPNIQFMPAGTGADNKELVTEAWVNTADFEKFRWPIEKMHSGIYRLEVTALNGENVTGKKTREFTVFEPGANVLPDGKKDFFGVNANSFKPGDTVKIYSGSAYDKANVIYHIKYYSGKKGNHGMATAFFERVIKKGITVTKWIVPADAVDDIDISQAFIRDNIVYNSNHKIFLYGPSNTPQVQIEQFRSKLAPGAATTFTVSIKTNNKRTAAQLMTTIYDASLDKLEEHKWQIPQLNKNQYDLRATWSSNINNTAYKAIDFLTDTTFLYAKKPVWWYGGNDDVMPDWNTPPIKESLRGRVAGLDITNAAGLYSRDVVVVGYGTSTESRRLLTGNVAGIKIRGIGSLQSVKQPLIMLDGVPFTGDLSSLDVKEITEMMVLKDAEASAIYGAAAAQGVLIISTKGPIQLPGIKEEPVVKVRRNFNETAFFSPAIYADKEGYYKFTFTMPESLTEWNWKLLAHTQDLKFAYEERKLVTQLPFMVQPHFPALVYEGDSLVLKTRISNIDTSELSGRLTCKIEDAVTGEDISSLLVKQNATAFAAGKKSNVTVAFQLAVPEKMLHPLKIMLLGRSGNLSDGEEQVIPVLSKQVLVKQNQTVLLQPGQVINKPRYVDKLYGVELSLQRNPQEALLYALPFLANYPYECAEQLSNKLFAHVTALMIMRKDTLVRRLYQQRVAKPGEPATTSLDDVSRETMPWLSLEERSRKEQDDLLNMLDTLRGREKITDFLKKLMALQKTDGGVSWFEGGGTSRIISFYVVEKLGQLLNAYNWQPGRFSYVTNKDWEEFTKKLVAYCDSKMLKATTITPGEWIAGSYARSFWKHPFPVDPRVETTIKSTISRFLEKDTSWSLREQALLCATAFRYFEGTETAYNKAAQLLQSVKQRAIDDAQNGTRWKELADVDEMALAGEETLVYLLDAFKAAGDTTMASGVIQWMLQRNNDGNWKTTTGTSAAIAVLLNGNHSLKVTASVLQARVADTSVTVADSLLSGNQTAFSKGKGISSLVVEKASPGPVLANIGWYYFTDSMRSLNQEVQLTKSITHFNKSTQTWEPVNNGAVLQTGETLQIDLQIESPKALRYVFIQDDKAAAFEPPVYESGYVWGGDFPYYASTRDRGKQFFIDFIPSGRTHIQYEMVLMHEGRFTCGAAKLECLYRPDITAYSNLQRIRVGD